MRWQVAVYCTKPMEVISFGFPLHCVSSGKIVPIDREMGPWSFTAANELWRRMCGPLLVRVWSFLASVLCISSLALTFISFVSHDERLGSHALS